MLFVDHPIDRLVKAGTNLFPFAVLDRLKEKIAQRDPLEQFAKNI